MSVTHLGPARCSTGSWRGAGSCPTGHWEGGGASDCLGHRKDTQHQHRAPHSQQAAQPHPRAPKEPGTRGQQQQEVTRATARALLAPQHSPTPRNLSHTPQSSEELRKHTGQLWAARLSPAEPG